MASTHQNTAEAAFTCADSLALGRYDNNILVNLDAIFVAEDTGEHDLGPVADGVDLQTGPG